MHRTLGSESCFRRPAAKAGPDGTRLRNPGSFSVGQGMHPLVQSRSPIPTPGQEGAQSVLHPGLDTPVGLSAVAGECFVLCCKQPALLKCFCHPVIRQHGRPPVVVGPRYLLTLTDAAHNRLTVPRSAGSALFAQWTPFLTQRKARHRLATSQAPVRCGLVGGTPIDAPRVRVG